MPRADFVCVLIFLPTFFLIVFVSNMSKSLCLLTLSLTPSMEAHWASSSVVFKMVLHFWPRLGGTKVFLSMTSLAPGSYPWLLNTGGTAQIPMLLSYAYLSSRGFDSPRTPMVTPSPKVARGQAAAAPHQGTGAGAERRRAGSCCALHHTSPSPEAAPAALHLRRHGAKQAGGRQSRLSHVCTS